MDRGHHGGRNQPREGERHEIGLVVNKVELTGLLEDMGDVEHLPHFRVDRGILGIGCRTNGIELACRTAIHCSKQGDVDAAGHQPFGEQRGELFPRPVVMRRDPP